MNTKYEILKKIHSIIQQNDISIYGIAKIAGINRTTLQKSISGTRSLNLRQFKQLVDVLPITASESRNLYSDYLQSTLSAEQVQNINNMLELFAEISNTLNKANTKKSATHSKSLIKTSNNYNRHNIIEVVRHIIGEELKSLNSDYPPLDFMCICH